MIYFSVNLNIYRRTLQNYIFYAMEPGIFNGWLLCNKDNHLENSTFPSGIKNYILILNIYQKSTDLRDQKKSMSVTVMASSE